MLARTLSIAAAIALIAGATSASAQAVDQDIRCMLASNVFANAEKDPVKKEIAVASSFFYLGRVTQRLAPAQLKIQPPAQGKLMNGQNVAQIMTDCAKRVQGVQRDMKAIGESIVAAEKAKAKS